MFDNRLRMATLAGAVSLLAMGALADDDDSTTFHATAVNLSNVGRPGVTQLDITIEHWSTEADADKLRDALIEKGDDALLKAVQKIKPRAGFIRTATSLGWDVQYARRTPLPEGGYRVVFVTDRPMRFGEVAHNTRSSDYEFMLVEIHVGADGKGEGKLVPRAKITYDRDHATVEIEDYASQPVRLTQVRVGGSKDKS